KQARLAEMIARPDKDNDDQIRNKGRKGVEMRLVRQRQAELHAQNPRHSVSKREKQNHGRFAEGGGNGEQQRTRRRVHESKRACPRITLAALEHSLRGIQPSAVIEL